MMDLDLFLDSPNTWLWTHKPRFGGERGAPPCNIRRDDRLWTARGREAIVDPEITRREVISRVTSGEYKNISFIHEIAVRRQ